MTANETVLNTGVLNLTQAGWAMQLVETASNLFMICVDNKIRYLNPAGVSLLELDSCKDVMGCDLTEFVHDDYKEFFSFGLEVLAEEEDFIPLKMKSRNQEDLDVKLLINEICIDGEDGHIIEVQNITEYKRASEAVRDREHRLKSILNTVTEGICTLDADGVIQTFNPAAEKIFGFSAQDVTGTPFISLVPDESRDLYDRFFRRYFLKNKKMMGKPIEMTGWNKDHGLFPMEMTVTRLQVGSETIYTGVFRDITERKQSEERIRHLAHHDSLTGLPNRHLFSDRLNHAIKVSKRYDKSLVLMFVDLDKFKPINDTLGHEAGDLVLKEVARRFRNVVREADTVARIGGDEFVILLEELDNADSGKLVATKILECLEIPILAAGRECVLGASIGIARYPQDSMDSDGLMRMADEAMYAVKTSGRNGYKVFETNLSVLGV